MHLLAIVSVPSASLVVVVGQLASPISELPPGVKRNIAVGAVVDTGGTERVECARLVKRTAVDLIIRDPNVLDGRPER